MNALRGAGLLSSPCPFGLNKVLIISDAPFDANMAAFLHNSN
jgi:hypothetical protein